MNKSEGNPVVLTAVAVTFLLLVSACTKQTAETEEATRGTADESVSAGDPSATSEPLAIETPSGSSSKSTAATVTKLRFENRNDTGLNFTHVAGHSSDRYLPETMGGGVVVADFNRDAAPDVLLLDSGRSLVGDNQTNEPGHRLFLNDGQGHFTDQTAAWQLTGQGYGMGAAVGDFDNDGWTDLLLTTFGGADQLLRNTGSSFVDVTEQAGLKPNEDWSVSAGFLDMDRDGDLDIYVVKYVDYSLSQAIPCYHQGFPIYCSPVVFDAVPDQLYRNNGDGTFTNVTESAGIPAHGKGLALAIGDLDRDGDTDIYVANDTTSNFLLINDGHGTFEDKAAELGVGYSSFGKEEAGMGSDFSDVNDDGLIDIVCTNYQEETTSLYLQQPQGHFFERSDVLGVGGTARQRLSFGIDFFDADNDGDEDLLVANGHIQTNVHEYETEVAFEQQNTLYERTPEGRLHDVTSGAGAALAEIRSSRGLATADLDSDGDIDFVIVNNDSAAQVAFNVTEDRGNFISIWLEGNHVNRSAIGSFVEAAIGERRVVRDVLGATSYLSACDHRLHFGLGDANAIDELIVHWAGGDTQTVRDVAAGKHYYLRQGKPLVEITPGDVVLPTGAEH